MAAAEVPAPISRWWRSRLHRSRPAIRRSSALNDGIEPRNSRSRGRGNSYGNWPRQDTQWVEYEWSQPISTNKIDVYWWADGQGVGLPSRIAACSIGTTASLSRSTMPKGLGVERDQFNYDHV